MADISINPQINKPIVTDTALKPADMKEEAAKEVAKDKSLITSEPIERSKIEADTLTTNASSVKKEEPVVTEEMIKTISTQVENVVSGKKKIEAAEDDDAEIKETRKKHPEPSEFDTSRHTINEEIKKAAEKTKDKTGLKTKLEPKTMAEYAQLKQEERKLKKVEKQVKAEQKAQAENSKMSSKKVVSSKNGKSTTISVKIVKDENGKWKAERPQTPEFNSYDRYMQNARAEYRQEHPEPAFSADDSDSESAEHSKWEADRKKNEKVIKKDYIKQNKAFAEQNAAYVKAQAKANELNG